MERRCIRGGSGLRGPGRIVPPGRVIESRLRLPRGCKATATMLAMTLARAWRRQLLGASSAALVVPSAMFAALVVLALGGGFSQLGVLGQIFAGPPAPRLGGAISGHAVGGAARSSLASIPMIPGPSRAPGVTPGVRSSLRQGSTVPVSTVAPGRAGGAAPILTQGAGGGTQRPAPPPGGSPPSGTAPHPPSPTPSPSPQPTPVDQVVQVVTSVTQQAPAPVGPLATQVVQSAGSAADSLLPPGPSLPQAPSVP